MARNALRLIPSGISGMRAGSRRLCAMSAVGPALPDTVVLIMITSVVSMPIDSLCMAPLLHHAHLPEADGSREQRFCSPLLILREHGLESRERRLDLPEAVETRDQQLFLKFCMLQEGGSLRSRHLRL